MLSETEMLTEHGEWRGGGYCLPDGSMEGLPDLHYLT
ncbi:hypothetical protein NGUA41_02673 [Salmonella enterica]|nr:hypothetical protein NGUA41_02673 [Salmonella enterica]